MGRIIMLVICSLSMGKKSFHQTDTFARQASVRRWLVSKRRMVASDSTLARVLPQVEVEEVREELAQSYQLLRQEGHGKVDVGGGRHLRIGVVDGSVLCGRYACGLEVVGEHAALIDVEPCEGRGKELVGSDRLIRRAYERHGKGFIDLLAYDGLGITGKLLTLVHDECGSQMLVKTKELDSLLILKDAEGIFRAYEQAREHEWRGVEHVKGLDLVREYRYETWATRGFHHEGYDGELKVARVRIAPLKGSRKEQQETFWTITTDVSLTAEQIREIAHLRWSIENHGWRAMNAQMKSKHQWVRAGGSSEMFEVLLLLMALTLTLMLAFHARLDAGRLWKSLHLRKITIAFMVESWLLSLHSAPVWSSSDG
ncbi:MAG: hypothetical protein A2Z34_08735 [Planctomycetes bacterium RBG_16_59_8]|nr:MAG: hypothetical protein A2Z34_08735 [Planctomycetes bacterium RBG_16_59_8]